MPDPILEAREIAVDYHDATNSGRGSTAVRAVDRFSLQLEAGEFVALVGESGSGKSSVANAILGLVRITAGELLIDGSDISKLRGRKARRARRPTQLIMQDPYEALDPHMTVGEIVEEPLIVHRLGPRGPARRERVRAMLESVGLTPAHTFENRRPHELSGGQRQRVCVAACLVLDPRILVADEPVSMLDVSVRAGILHLLDQLRTKSSAGVLMITHDLPTAAAFCDRILVMKDGSIVEQGTANQITQQPREPYTRELLAATPRFQRRAKTASTGSA